MFLQGRAQFFQALAIGLGQWIVNLVQAPIDAQKRRIFVRRFFVTAEEAINARPQHRSIATHEPVFLARLADHQLPVETQLRQDLAPALGNRLLDNGQVEDAALNHLQHIFDRQRRVDPFDLDRRQFVQRQFLIELTDRLPRRTAGRQRQGFAGELFDLGVAPLALDPDQHQRHVAGDRFTAGHRIARLQIEQFARRDQITFAALQGAEQLILGFGNDLEGDFLAVTGVAIEVLLEGAQAMVFDADGLALNFTGAVAALVDQHAQHAAAANLGQVTHLGRRHGLQRPGQARNRRHRQQQRTTQQEQNRGTNHPLSGKNTGQFHR